MCSTVFIQCTQMDTLFVAAVVLSFFFLLFVLILHDLRTKLESYTISNTTKTENEVWKVSIEAIEVWQSRKRRHTEEYCIKDRARKHIHTKTHSN